jgi:hypothetical protein
MLQHSPHAGARTLTVLSKLPVTMTLPLWLKCRLTISAL